MKNLLTAVFLVIILIFGAWAFVKIIRFDAKNIDKSRSKAEVTFDTKTITARVMEMSDLVTANTECIGSVKYERYEEKFGPDAYAKYLLNYSSEIETRIDLSKVSIEDDNFKVIVKMPNPIIKYNEPKIIEFHLLDRSFRDVSLTEGQMLLEATNLIPTDIQKRVKLHVMKDRAKKQAKIIIRDLIKSFDKDNKYNIEFEFFDDIEMEEDIINII